jgi:hypothetical protein
MTLELFQTILVRTSQVQGNVLPEENAHAANSTGNNYTRTENDMIQH